MIPEHTAHKSDDDREYWLTCNDTEVARIIFQDAEMAAPALEVVQTFLEATMRAHAIAAHHREGEPVAEIEWLRAENARLTQQNAIMGADLLSVVMEGEDD